MPNDKKKLRIPRFHLNKEDVPIIKSFQYLGHILSKDGTDDLDIERQRRYMLLVIHCFVNSTCVQWMSK